MKINTVKNKSSGFTLIEVIIAISIFVVLLFAVIDLLLGVFNNPQQQIISLDRIDQARMVANNFSNELRNARIGNDGSYPITQATNSQIVFYSSYGATSPAIKRIRYYILNNNLYKGVVIPTGNPLTYNLSSESVTQLVEGLGNGATPIFYYYTGDYNGSGGALSEPINVNQVKFVKINLMVPRETTAQSTDTFSINAGVNIRNLKNNLGN